MAANTRFVGGTAHHLLASVAEGARAGSAEALARVREAVAARRAERGGHDEWARLCEEAGEFGLALSEYQLAIRDDPDDADALGRLAALYEERGEPEHAVECAERRFRLRPEDIGALGALIDLLIGAGALERAGEVVESARGRIDPVQVDAVAGRLRTARSVLDDEEEGDAEEPAAPTDADVVRFAHLFAGRENVYARQWWNQDGRGGYTPVHEPFTFQVARNHLLGNVTVGTYPIRLDGTATFFAVDLDITKRALETARSSVAEARRLRDLVAREARRMLDDLAVLGLPAVLEDSGYKGRHLWVFLEAPEDAAVLRQLGSLLLGACGPTSPDLHAEFFPKQASTGAGIGNLIKLPLGIHRRTGRWSRIFRADGLAEPAPHAALRQHPRVSREALHAAIAALKRRESGPRPAAPEAGEGAEQAPAWTAADFDTHPEVGHLMGHCPVLVALRDKAEKNRRLTHDEQVVLAHTVGHSGAGVLAVNYLLDRCVDVAPTAALRTPLSGNPMSCAKIRKRIPHVSGSVACNCRFDFAQDHYPTPRLHLRTLDPAALAQPAPRVEPAWDPAERARLLGGLRRRQAELERESKTVEGELLCHLERSGLDILELDEGVFRVRRDGIVAALEWEPKTA
ncbi:MAG: hypothetical protein HYV93_23485 [Candidatus Rokubacteria bacterium]|nr:hypothetical protein [Candidatus Rokubacteria bacterium]